MNSAALALLAVLSVVHDKTYKSPQDFLHRHHATLSSVCARYHASKCQLRKESGGTVDELGFAVENSTAEWVLYGIPNDPKKFGVICPRPDGKIYWCQDGSKK